MKYGARIDPHDGGYAIEIEMMPTDRLEVRLIASATSSARVTKLRAEEVDSLISMLQGARALMTTIQK